MTASSPLAGRTSWHPPRLSPGGGTPQAPEPAAYPSPGRARGRTRPCPHPPGEDAVMSASLVHSSIVSEPTLVRRRVIAPVLASATGQAAQSCSSCSERAERLAKRPLSPTARSWQGDLRSGAWLVIRAMRSFIARARRHIVRLVGGVEPAPILLFGPSDERVGKSPRPTPARRRRRLDPQQSWR